MDGIREDSTISFSSDRCNALDSTIGSSSAWCAESTARANHWIQLSFQSPKSIRAISSQGHPSENQWVEQFVVKSSLTGLNWIDEGLFDANSDSNTACKK